MNKSELKKILASLQVEVKNDKIKRSDIKKVWPDLWKPTAEVSEDAAKILELFKKNFKYVRVSGKGSSRNVIFEFEIEEGLMQPEKIKPFAEAFGIPPKDVVLKW